MRLTLEQLFGEGSYQDIDKVVISKLSLPLTPSETNTAQSLFAALLEKARVNYHSQLSANGEWLTVDGVEPLEYDASSNYDELNIFYSRNQIKGEYFVCIYKVIIRELVHGN